MKLNPFHCLPVDHDQALLVGRIWSPAVDGPIVVSVAHDGVYDLTALAATVSELLEQPNAAAAIRTYAAPRLAGLDTVLANSVEAVRDPTEPWFLAPSDLQALKASGVTFVASLLERLIEERAKGEPQRAEEIRTSVVAALGTSLRNVRPGSPEAARAKDILMQAGMWSQYLEVGIGPDAEVFTKSQPMSAVGIGTNIGVLESSGWNNPEPEVVLAVNSRGEIVGATLGNDVNLRDLEGRSALLLGKAKDNNASCALGPFIRLFDATYGLDEVRAAEVVVTVRGLDGFELEGRSTMSEISRDPAELVAQTIGPNHQYPDGMMLFLGTMFAPTADRAGLGQGFTHVVGDEVTIASERLGALVNRVDYAHHIAPWTFGVGALMRNLAKRGLLRA
jgi:fumarylacetoacetate (FAA) hydrolase family protein